MSNNNPLIWITGHDTGTSSKTIWAVMMKAVDKRAQFGSDYYVPLDTSDFGRCYRLLKQFPEWRPRMKEVAKIFPMWSPFVEHWDELTKMYELVCPSPGAWNMAASSAMCDFMVQLLKEGYVLAGWVETSSGAWELPEAPKPPRRKGAKRAKKA